MLLDNISIIIPTASDENALAVLLNDLKDTDAQIIISSENTRAKSMNIGATKAERQYLWFLHADSCINADNLRTLEQSLKQAPNALHYFDLTFDGSGLIKLNAWGANIRSRIFGMPYGDQGLCISAEQFKELGGYREDIPYGEDLILILHARKCGVKLKHISSKLLTSSRKYKTQGWLKLTILRQWHLIKLLRVKP